MKELDLVKILKIAIILVAIGSVCMAFFELPFVAQKAAQEAPEYANFKMPILIFVYISLIPYFLGLYNVYNLCNLIEKEKHFSKESVKIFKNLSMYSFLEVLLYSVGTLVMLMFNALAQTYFLIMCIVVFFAVIISIFCKVLSVLFETAKNIKEENELTI